MENTLENKARFYSQYLFTGVIFKYQNTSWGKEIVDKESALDLSILDLIMSHTDIHEDYANKVRNGFLDLKPLSSITDEDAFNYAKNYLGWTDPEDYKKWFLDQGCQIKGHRHADYLRSQGYALPWMGLSVETLVEFGWIKLKNIE